jgi:hypothetical protein
MGKEETRMTTNTHIHFNRLTFPSFAFPQWAIGRGAPELEPETAAGLMLREILGTDAPKSVLVEVEDEIAVHAWGSDFSRAAERFSGAIQGAEVTSREIETALLAGTFQFRLTCSPVIRRNGVEIDAFVAARKTDSETTRSAAYLAWLKARLKGAELLELSVVKAGAAEIKLPGQKPFRKPSAILEGRLEVKDPTSFAETLRRGIGRHGGLGFGTLIIGRA